MKPKAKWTFMVYLAGDNNLSAAGDGDLAEMRRVGSTEEVNVVAEFDNAGAHGTRRFHIGRSGVGETVESLGETDSGSPEVLTSFIRWAAENHPAERYALILWNHGTGWAPTEVDRIARSAGARGYNEREIGERTSSRLGRAFFRSTLETVFSAGNSAERAICSDDGSGHSLDTVELHRVLSAGVAALGQPIDLLGMDACLMSNLEVAFQVRDQVRYIVASEENEPAEGWPYDRVLSRLVTTPGMKTAELGSGIVNDYIDWYRERGERRDLTQALVDVAKLSTLIDPLDELAGYMTDNMAVAHTPIWRAQKEAAQFNHGTLWDIGHFCEELARYSDDTRLRDLAGAVLVALQQGPSGVIVAEAHSGSRVERCKGLSVHITHPFAKISPHYRDLDFAKRRWLPMMERYISF